MSAGTVNIRSFRPGRDKGNPFEYGIGKVEDAARIVGSLAAEGYSTIVNETIDTNDGGVSGVTLGGVMEFTPFDTPRGVEKAGVASLPHQIGLDVLRGVYGFTPDVGAAPATGSNSASTRCGSVTAALTRCCGSSSRARRWRSRPRSRGRTASPAPRRQGVRPAHRRRDRPSGAVDDGVPTGHRSLSLRTGDRYQRVLDAHVPGGAPARPVHDDLRVGGPLLRPVAGGPGRDGHLLGPRSGKRRSRIQRGLSPGGGGRAGPRGGYRRTRRRVHARPEATRGTARAGGT